MTLARSSSLRCATALLACAMGAISSAQAPAAVSAAAGNIPAPPAPTVEEMKHWIGLAAAAGQPESSATAPFHLRATIETFDYRGKSDGTGTLEAFWDGKQRSRHAITYREHTRVEIRDADGIYTSDDGFRSSLSENLIIASLFQPLPSPQELDRSELTYKEHQQNGLAMDCVIVASKIPPELMKQKINWVAAKQGYCMAQKMHLLRIAQASDQMMLVYDELTPYSGKFIPHKIVVLRGAIIRAKLQIQDISDWTPDEAPFTVPAGARQAPSTVSTSNAIIAGHILKSIPPIYPPIAKLNRISGSVFLHALISRTGDITDLEIVSSPDPSLADSAMDAVRQWKYKPYLLNGQPTEVETTITVNFAL